MKIYRICKDCAKQLYPLKIRRSKQMKGITAIEGNCDICGEKKILTPLRDYFYAIGHQPSWD